MTFGYLACPYSHRDKHVMHARHVQICMIAARLIEGGAKFYCPIAHTHPIAHYGGMDLHDLKIWIPFDRPMMAKCDELWIVKMDGWQESSGIQYERAAFVGRPIRELEPNDPMAELIS